MRLGTRSLCPLGLAIGLVTAGADARAANAEFQDYFFSVCGAAPSGALAARCGETPSGLGNLSGDSESSLNPSQNLSHGQPILSSAVTRSNAARERTEHLRGADAGGNGAAEQRDMRRGSLGALINAHVTDLDRHSDGAVEPERGFEGDSRAFEIGFDYRVSDRVVLGAILGMERGKHEFDPENAGVNFTPAAHAGETDLDNRYLTLFGSFALGSAGYIELAGGYEMNEGEYQRFSVFQESTRTVTQTNVATQGEADGTATWVSLNLGVDLARGAWSVGPYAGIMRSEARLDGYTERESTSSGLAMNFEQSTRDSLLAHAGLRASVAFSGAAGVFVPQLRAEYRSELEDSRQEVTAGYVLDTAGTRFLMSGADRDRNWIEAGFSLLAVLPNGWMTFLDYDLLIDSDDLDRQRATLGLRIEF